MQRVSDVALLGVGSNYMWLAPSLGRRIPKVVMRNDVGGGGVSYVRAAKTTEWELGWGREILYR